MSASQLGSSGAARLDYQPLFWTNKPLLRVTKDCTQETAEIEPWCNYVPCILSPSKALKDGAVARIGLELDQRTIVLHKRTCTCRYSAHQGYYGLLLSLRFAL